MKFDVPIGTQVFINDRHVVAVEDYSLGVGCVGCVLISTDCEGICCLSRSRNDKKTIHFEFVEEGGDNED